MNVVDSVLRYYLLDSIDHDLFHEFGARRTVMLLVLAKEQKNKTLFVPIRDECIFFHIDCYRCSFRLCLCLCGCFLFVCGRHQTDGLLIMPIHSISFLLARWSYRTKLSSIKAIRWFHSRSPLLLCAFFFSHSRSLCAMRTIAGISCENSKRCER